MPQPNAARVALVRDFLTPENKHLLVPREERVAEMIVEGKSYVDIGEDLSVTVARVIQIADRVVRIIKREQRNCEWRALYEERFAKLSHLPPEEVKLSDYLDGQLMGVLKKQGIDTGAKLLEAFDTDALLISGQILRKKAKEFIGLMSRLHTPHIIWFEDAFKHQGHQRYGSIGPFPSSAAACRWLEENGFYQGGRLPNNWIKSTESTFMHPSTSESVTVDTMQAWVEILKTPDQLKFVPQSVERKLQ